MKTFYMQVQLPEASVGCYIDAENCDEAWRVTEEKFNRRKPRQEFIVITAQEMAESCIRY